MSSVQVENETIKIYTITLPGQDEPIVLRLSEQVAQDLVRELLAAFNPNKQAEQAPLAPVISAV